MSTPMKLSVIFFSYNFFNFNFRLNILMNWKVFSLFVFYGTDCVQVIFFLKYMIGFISKIMFVSNFECVYVCILFGKFLTLNLIYLIGLFNLSISESLVVL